MSPLQWARSQEGKEKVVKVVSLDGFMTKMPTHAPAPYEMRTKFADPRTMKAVLATKEEVAEERRKKREAKMRQRGAK